MAITFQPDIRKAIRLRPRPMNGSTWFAGTETGDYRSTDNGATWANSSTGLLDGIGRIIPSVHYFKSSTGRILRAGGTSSWNNKVGSPVFYSDNNGTSWSESPLPFTNQNGQAFGFLNYTEKDGALYSAGSLQFGVWKSTDDGLTWAGLPSANLGLVRAIASNSGGIYVATVNGLGVYRSTDAGLTWAPASNGIPTHFTGIFGQTRDILDIISLPDGTLYANAENSLFKSNDNAENWIEVANSLNQGQIESISSDGSKIYAYTKNNVLMETVDGGVSFSIVNGGTAPVWPPSTTKNLTTGNGVAIYKTGSQFFRLDLNAAPRLPILPVIAEQPKARGVNIGKPLVLSVTHSNATLPISYVWKRDGNIVPSQNGPILTIPSATLGDAGNYTVEITNGAGTVVSPIAAAVNVVPSTPGNIDYTLQPLTLGSKVNAAIQAPDGSLFVAGEFFSSTTIPGRRLVRIRPDNTLDPDFKPDTATINFEKPFALRPLSDGSVIMAGGNTQYFRRVDSSGKLDAGFDWPEELAGETYAMAAGPGDTTYVGGSFGLYRIFNTNGHIDYSFNPPSLNGVVRSIAITPDDRVVIGGLFSSVNGKESRRVARLLSTGVLDSSFSVGTGSSTGGFNSDVFSVVVQADGKIVAGGRFTTFRGAAAVRVARLNVDGTLDTAFAPPSPNGDVNGVVIDGQGGIVFAGAFNNYGSNSSNAIARLDPVNGSQDTNFPGLPTYTPILSLSIQPDGNILTGTGTVFTRLLGPAPSTPRISFLSGDTAAAAGQSASLEVRVSGPSAGASFKWFKNGVLLPGDTAAILSRPSLSIADVGHYRVEITIGATVLRSETTRLDLLGSPYFITTPETTPGAGGYRHHFSARAKGTGIISYEWFKNGTPVPNATGPGLFLSSLTESDAGTYFVRAKNSVGSIDTAPFYFAVLPKQGNFDPSFVIKPTAAGNQSVAHRSLLLLSDGKYLVGGLLDASNLPSPYLRRYFADGSLDETFSSQGFGLTQSVDQILRQSTGKIIVKSSNKTIRLNADLTLDGTFTAPSTSIAQIVLLPDDKLLVRGNSISGYSSGFYRTNSNGSVDTGFPATTFVGGNPTMIALDDSGKILLAGAFSQVNGIARRKVARLNSNGTLDTVFTGPSGTSASSGTPTFIDAAPDGSVFIGGTGIGTIVDEAAGDLIKLDKTTGAHLPGFFPTGRQGTVSALEFFADGRIGLFGSFPGSTTSIKTIYQTRFTNGAADPSAYGEDLPFGTPSGPPYSPQPSLPGTYVMAGDLTPAGGRIGAFRIFTGEVPLAFVKQPATSVATTPANTVNLGSSVTLTASALGTSAVSYRWFFNDALVPGATSNTLTFNSVQKANKGSYTLEAMNSSGTVLSSPVYLDVLAEPEILTHPITTTLSSGGNVTLSVTAKGRPTLSYAWTRDGVTLVNASGKISGATTATLTLTGVTQDRAGAYRAVVTNSLGSTLSNIADIIPTFAAGAVDASWTESKPSIPNGNYADLIPTSDGGFYITAPFNFNNRRNAAKYNSAGVLDATFVPPANSTIDVLTKRIFAVDSNNRLHVLVRSPGTNSSTSYVFRYEADGTPTQLAILFGAAEHMIFDSQNRLVIVGIGAERMRRYTVSGNTLVDDTTFRPNVNNFIYGVYPSPSTGGYYIIGGFFQVDGVARNGGLARITSTGALDTTFGDYSQSGTLAFDKRTFIHELPNGKVHVRNLRLNADATRDTSWNATASGPNNSEIGAIIGGFVDPAGKIVILSTGKVRRYLENGNADTTFSDPGPANFHDILQLPCGQVYAAGSSSIGGKGNLVRLNYESSLIGFSSKHADLTVDTGQSATFTAGVFGTGITYKWYKNGTLLANGGSISGADSASLTVAGASVADSGSIRLEVSNASGLASHTAFLTVNPPPSETFAGWAELATVAADKRGPLDDPDGDGLPNLIEFALKLAPGTFNGNPHPTSFVAANGVPYPSVTFTRRKDLGGTTLTVQISEDLTYATDLGSTVVSVTDNNNGTETVVVRSNVAQSAVRAQFFRLKAL